jgi:cytochrome c biogenesis protein CcdA
VASATADAGIAGRFRWPTFLGLMVALAVGTGLATVFWTTGLVDGAYIADFQDKLDTAQTGPGVAVATLIALGIGASMVVLPCGFPAVFMVPAILERSEHTAGRLRSLTAYALGGVIPLAVAGLALGLAGGGILDLLTGPQSRMWFAAVTYTALGAGALVYALAEFGVISVRTPFERVTGPSLPGTDAPARRSLVLGATFGGGLGIACPMPTYYALLGWVVVAASGWYGALVLGAYGLGRMLVPVVLGLLMVAGTSRRAVAERMAAVHGRVIWASSVTTAALGAFMVTLFGGFLGTSLL